MESLPEAEIDDVVLRATVVNDVITTEGDNRVGLGTAKERVGRRSAGNGVVTRSHKPELSWWVS